jgi:polysaccharide biosynthesis protein PslG
VVRGTRGQIRSILIAAIAVVALSAAAWPSPASAKPSSSGPVSLFGSNPWEPPSQEEYQRMAAGGLGSIRLLMTGVGTATGPGPRDWRLYDSIVGDAAMNGISVDPWLMYLPPWISTAPATLPIGSEAQRSYWFDFVREAAARYGPGGAFWRQNPGIPARPMTFWEIWNEPNINEFNGVNMAANAGQFAQLLRLTRSALNAANPANRIVLGGLYRRAKRGHGVRMSVFLNRLYKLRHGRRLFDAVGVHPYATKPSQVLAVTRTVRRVMNQHGDRRKPIWITELGWTTGGRYWGQSLYRATLDTQAFKVARTAQLLLRNRRALALRRVDWHTWRDYPGSDDYFWEAYSGLFLADGRPKPAWGAFTRVTGGTAGGQIHTLGHFPIPPGPLVPPGGTAPGNPPPPPPPPPPPQGCFLIIFCPS